ncbi:MAG TPA: YciI family protein [Actinomycetota bacterium]|nr:YciI family protein [Actinomycetota bacterium]
MLYSLLIYENAEELAMDPDAQKRHAAEFGEFVAAVADKIRGGAPLKLPEDATTIRIRNGETITTDGPFAETKEILAGFFLIELDNLDEALAAAEKIPVAKYGAIEVRPVATELMEMVNEESGGQHP